MNVVKIYGGLGNQLFQYAFGKAMAINNIQVQYDILSYKNEQDPPRPYILDKFHTTVHKGVLSQRKTINEVATHYIKNMDYLRMDEIDFCGYWQHPGYFTDVLPILKEEFKVRKEFYTEEFIALREKIICDAAISLHVRRGDYVRINGHYLLGLEYYENALKLIPQGLVYVFSDDIQWCRENFKGARFVFVDIVDYLAFDLMRVCTYSILANSTYSWWAAYLKDNLGIVITPRQWRRDKNDPAMCDSDFILPAGWMQIASPGVIT